VANVNTFRDTWSDRHPGTNNRTADAVSYGMQPGRPAMSSRMPSTADKYASAYADENAGTD
jgi:hypothetical protein